MIDVWSVHRYLAVGLCIPGKTFWNFVLFAWGTDRRGH